MSAREPDAETSRHIVVLGKIVGAFGIQGWVKVESFTDPPDNLLDYRAWLLSQPGGEPAAQWETRHAIESRVTAKGIVARLDGVADRNAAELLRGRLVGVPRDQLPTAAPGEYYWDDLLNVDAYTVGGEHLGRIREIRSTAAHALMVIAGSMGGKPVEHLVPLVKERLKKVDLGQRRAIIDWDASWT